jgi:hypothetical protein
VRTTTAAVGLLLAACTTRDVPADRAASRPPADTAPAAHPADSTPSPTGWQVGPRSAGPVQFGVTPASGGDGCHYTVPAGAPAGLRFMAEAGHIVRADVDSGGPATDRGARVGMSEADILRLYPEGLRSMPHKYEPAGHYLVFTPPGADSGFHVVFETDGQRVTTYRAGVEPAVEYVERCG